MEVLNRTNLHFPKIQKWKWLYSVAAEECKRKLWFVDFVCPVMVKLLKKWYV